MKRLMAFLGFVLVFTASAFAQENSLLWKISSPDGKTQSYLFGTYHIIGSDYLKEHLKADLAQLDQFKPVFISIMYSLALAQKYTPEKLNYGGQAIDQYFAHQGKKSGKKVYSLESSAEQAEILFNSKSLEEQIEDLVEMAKDKEAVVKMTKSVIQSYLDEDLKTMYEEAKNLEEASGDLDVLLDDRNLRWIEILKPILSEGNAFIAVGALHLPGEKGLIELLQKEGYILSPVLK